MRSEHKILWGAAAVIALIIATRRSDSKGPASDAHSATNDTPSVSVKGAAIRDLDIAFKWHKGGFQNVMIVDFTFTNNGDHDVKDITVRCVHTAPSGTVIDRNEKTIYDVVPAKAKKRIPDFSMGFIDSQATSSNCQVIDLTIVP